jgi:hypothetical protein
MGSAGQTGSYPVDTGEIFPDLNPPGYKDKRSTPSSTEVKNARNSISTPLSVFMVNKFSIAQ